MKFRLVEESDIVVRDNTLPVNDDPNNLDRQIVNKIVTLSKALADEFGWDYRLVMKDIIRDLRIINGEDVNLVANAQNPIDALTYALASDANQLGVTSNEALHFLLDLNTNDAVKVIKDLISGNRMLRGGNRGTLPFNRMGHLAIHEALESFKKKSLDEGASIYDGYEEKRKKSDVKGAKGWFVHPNPGDPEAMKRFNKQLQDDAKTPTTPTTSSETSGEASAPSGGDGSASAGGMGESLLQDLHKDHLNIKDEYGEDIYKALDKYCSYPENDLGDVLYSEHSWDKFIAWCKENGYCSNDVNEGTDCGIIAQMPIKKQRKIRHLVKQSLKDNGIVGKEFEDRLHDAMTGRLCDLEDAIDLSKLDESLDEGVNKEYNLDKKVKSICEGYKQAKKDALPESVKYYFNKQDKNYVINVLDESCNLIKTYYASDISSKDDCLGKLKEQYDGIKISRYSLED